MSYAGLTKAIDEDMMQDITTDLSIIAALEHPNVSPYESHFFTKVAGKTCLGAIRPYYKTSLTEAIPPFRSGSRGISEKVPV